ncbi:antitoxin Xre-like helix-turn-helix domain-containing protein [Bosea sp. ASV33]|uniref:antitoxin Xre-like helix-turn-helix domain-containing protein n=1 Tax=Bosea sp. ASV33 TaxID=2795106 RepID=UPI0032C1BCCF
MYRPQPTGGQSQFPGDGRYHSPDRSRRPAAPELRANWSPILTSSTRASSHPRARDLRCMRSRACNGTLKSSRNMLIEIPRTAANPDIPRITADEASAAARAVVRLFEKWSLSDAVACDILGGLSTRRFTRWKAGLMAGSTETSLRGCHC